MIDVSELIHDPDFCTGFTIIRREGRWTEDGTYTTEASESDVMGVVRPASGADLQMIPEGDERRETLNFLTLEKTYLTDENHLADVFRYRGKTYKAVSKRDWKDHGFYKTTATLIEGDE